MENILSALFWNIRAKMVLFEDKNEHLHPFSPMNLDKLSESGSFDENPVRPNVMLIKLFPTEISTTPLSLFEDDGHSLSLRQRFMLQNAFKLSCHIFEHVEGELI